LSVWKKVVNFLKENKTSVIAIGRVMTCVLGLVVDREQEIRNFMPKALWHHRNVSVLCQQSFIQRQMGAPE